MPPALTAALLSAFVFPGAGHLYLHRPLRGCVFLVPALVAAFVFLGDVMRRASALADQVVAGTLPLDPAAIAGRLHAQGGVGASATISGAVLVVCWIGSIVDSFVLAQGAPRRTD